MSVDPTAYRPPADARSPATTLGCEAWECLRVSLTISTVWVLPWCERPGTNLALVERPHKPPERAHVAPATIEALKDVGRHHTGAVIASPAWPIVDGPTPTSQIDA